MSLTTITANVERRRGKKVKTADGFGWTTVPDGIEIGCIVLTLDIPLIMAELGAKALHNRTGRAKAMSGRIVAKVVSRREKK